MCCFRRKPSSSAENRQRTTPFAPRHPDCRSDTVELVRPDNSLSFEAHPARACDTPEQIMESMGGRLVIPYPDGDGWREGIECRHEPCNPELTTPHHHKHPEAGWDKEFESFAERRGQAVPSSPDTGPTPRRIAKPDAVERVHGTQYRNAKPEPRHHVAPFPPNPPNADTSSGPKITTTLSKR